MMTALREALEKKGFTPPHSVIREEMEAKALVYLAQEAKNLAAGKRDRDCKDLLEKLKETSSVQKFRVLAKKLLLIDPQKISEVTDLAHTRGIKEKRKEGGAALIAQLLQARSALQAHNLSEEEMVRIINRTISKH